MDIEHSQARMIGTLLHDTTRLLRRRFDDAAKAYGLTLPQWKALVAIDKQDGITQVALSSSLDTDAMTLSGILDRLEKRGLIERFVHPDDSRAKLTRLTSTGVELVAVARGVGAQVFNQAMDGMTPADLAMLIEQLTRIQTNLINAEQANAATGKDS
ncbi:MAG: MarR family winged helix-turn-helix transcriptional regulator [Devosia sp.]